MLSQLFLVFLSLLMVMLLLYFLISNALPLSQALLNAIVAHPPHIYPHGIMFGYGVEVTVETEACKQGELSMTLHE